MAGSFCLKSLRLVGLRGLRKLRERFQWREGSLPQGSWLGRAVFVRSLSTVISDIFYMVDTLDVHIVGAVGSLYTLLPVGKVVRPYSSESHKRLGQVVPITYKQITVVLLTSLWNLHQNAFQIPTSVS